MSSEWTCGMWEVCQSSKWTCPAGSWIYMIGSKGWFRSHQYLLCMKLFWKITGGVTNDDGRGEPIKQQSLRVHRRSLLRSHQKCKTSPIFTLVTCDVSLYNSTWSFNSKKRDPQWNSYILNHSDVWLEYCLHVIAYYFWVYNVFAVIV